MKSAFLYIIAILTCSECVLGDLEFYPESKRSEADVSEDEWNKDPQPPSDLQRYLQQVSALYRQDRERSSYPYGALRRNKPTRPLDPSWPSTVARHIFSNKDLALRLINRNERPHGGPTRSKQYFKILPSGRDPNSRFNRILQKEEADALLSLFKAHPEPPPTHGLYDMKGLDFSISNAEEEGAGDDSEEMESHDHHSDYDESSELVNDDNELLKYELDKVYNPTEFAYAPSDHHYFQDAEKTESTVPLPNENPEDEIQDNDVYHFPYKLNKAIEEQVQTNHDRVGADSDVISQKSSTVDDTAGVYIIAVVAGISAAATVGLIAFGIGWYNLQKHVKNASDVDYPAYGITGPNKDISPSGDRRLAQSAQMYHYQHQKQQIIAMERAAANERRGSVSEAESDEENEEGDYTVYECPGLAPTGEMEVKNPLFQDDPTPAQTPGMKSSENGGMAQKK